MDSPRGRVYQMVQVSNGAPITPSYEEHIGLCLACRGCESACPSGVPYGRMVEDARRQIEAQTKRGRVAAWLRDFVFRKLLVSPRALMAAGGGCSICTRSSGLKGVDARAGLLPSGRQAGRDGATGAVGRSAVLLQPDRQDVSRARASGGYRVAFLAGCIANVSFARLNEATVRVLQKNGCEVAIPAGPGLLRRAAPARRPARGRAATGAAQHRRAGERRLRRHHHQRGRLRVDAEGIRRAAGGRSAVRRQGARCSRRRCAT